MFTNVNKASTTIKEAVDSGVRILAYGDYDVDGACAVATSRAFFKYISYENFEIVSYTKRTHHVDPNILIQALTSNVGLIILSDTGSGTGDKVEIERLAKIAKVIVADHHNAKYALEELENVIFVNPTYFDNFSGASGACVTYEIYKDYIGKYQEKNLQDFVKQTVFYPFMSIYSDSVYGNNQYCRQIHKDAQTADKPSEFNYLKYYSPSKRFALFSFAPPLNACFRNESFDIINSLMFSKKELPFSDKQILVDRMEELRDTSRQVVNLITQQVKYKEIGEFILVDLTGYLNQSVPNHVLWNNKGLVAGQIAGREKKCVVSIVSKGDHYLLSCRDYWGRDILSLMESFFKVGGHSSAFGGYLGLSDVLLLEEVLASRTFLGNTKDERIVKRFSSLLPEEFQEMAYENEFRKENNLYVLDVPFSHFQVGKSPERFTEQFESLILTLPDRRKVYIPREDWSRQYSSLKVALYLTNGLRGMLVK